MTLTPAPLPWREREKGRGGFFNVDCGINKFKGAERILGAFIIREHADGTITKNCQGPY
jgi:hypothetical protein